LHRSLGRSYSRTRRQSCFRLKQAAAFIRQRGFRGFHPKPDRLAQIFVDGHQQGLCVAVKNLRAKCSVDLLGCRRCPRSSKVEKYRNGRSSHRNSENGWPKGWYTEQTHSCSADGDSDGSQADQCCTRLGGFSRRRTRPAYDRRLPRSGEVPSRRIEISRFAVDGSRLAR